MTNNQKEKIVRFIKEIYKTSEEVIPLHEPRFIGNEKKYMNDCIKSGYVSSVGKYVNEFEKKIANYTGSKYAIATVNGTAALHIALLLCGVKQDDEVLTQPLTFIATANSINYIKAHPVFIDIDLDTLSLSPSDLEDFLANQTYRIPDGTYNKNTNRKIAACVPVHTFGHPAKIDKIIEVCSRYKIPVIEDAAESLGSKFKNKHTGTFGEMGILSFNGNKILTTGGGGMILTNNEHTAQLAKHLTTTAKVTHKWEFEHDAVGYNYRMPNINAALGLAQLENLDFFLSNKRDVAKKYIDFCSNEGFNFFQEPENSSSNFWLNTLILEDVDDRDDFLDYCHTNKVLVRPAWKLMNHLVMYNSCQKTSLQNSEFMENSIINLPSSVTI